MSSQSDTLLADLNDYVDGAGRQYSPFLERGADNVPARLPVPDVDDLRAFGIGDPKVMNAVLQRYGLSNTPDKLLEEQSKYLERFNARTGSALYDTQRLDLMSNMEGRILLGQARRVSQRYETLVLLDGDYSKRVIYVAEGDAPCDGCAPLAGTIGTAAELQGEGIWPGEQCLGGDQCLCQIMVYE